jgi:hypothetical protein
MKKRQNKSQRQKINQMKKNMKRQSPSVLQMFMPYRTPWRTSDFRFRIYREMHAMIGSSYKPCCKTFYLDCHLHQGHLLQLQGFLQHHLSDILSTLSLCITFVFSVSTHCGHFEFQVWGCVYTCCFQLCSFIFNYGFIFFCKLNLMNI